MIIRNNTGGDAALPSVNITEPIANGATVDLMTDLGDGVALNDAGDLHRDGGLREAISSGAWSVVIDGADVSVSEGMAALTTAAHVFEGALRIVAKGDKRRVLEVTNVVVQGQLCFSFKQVTAAQLAADNGVLIIRVTDPLPGVWVEIEAGATLNGIQIVGDDDSDDITDSAPHVRFLTLQSGSAAPYAFTAVHEHAGTAAHLRLRCTGMTPGSYASGPVTENHILIGYDPIRKRWRFPWTAP